MLAAKLGFDGLGTNEHHQNAYGFMCNPNLFGRDPRAAHAGPRLRRRRHRAARRDDRRDLAADPHRRGVRDPRLHQRRPARRRPPLGLGVRRGRLATASRRSSSASAGARRSSSCSRRGRRRRSSPGTASTTSCRKVNLWPRPIQEPHPPLLVPGAAARRRGTTATSATSPYAFLSYFGGKPRRAVMDRYWDRADANGRDRNPYRAAFLQLVGVADTDEQAEAEFGRARRVLLQEAACTARRSTSRRPATATTRACSTSSSSDARVRRPRVDLKPLSAKDMIERGFVVVGSPATVRDRLDGDGASGSTSAISWWSCSSARCRTSWRWRTSSSSRREVLPHLQSVWDDEGWENKWWPKTARAPTPRPRAAPSGQVGA